MEINIAHLVYDDRRIGVKQLSGRLGKSTFSGVSGSVGLKKNRQLKIASARSHIVLSEFFPRLSSNDD